VTAALLAALALALSPPFRAEEENVRRGNDLLARGDSAAALSHYARAEREAGDRPELDYDRALAAYRLGRLAEASDGFARAAARAEPALASRALQNLGNAHAASGDEEGALAAFRDALRKDPGNEDARYDLEVLLRRRDARHASPPPAGSGASAKPSPDGPKEGGAPPPRPGATPEAGGPRGAGGSRPGDAPARDRAGAERMLDALRAREKALPARAAERGRPRRADAAKDW
jgi:Ca-activated chloride channel family protein